MDPRFVLLLACFFLSGFAALLYQTAWTRELSFVFGTSHLAVAAVLAAYMGGLALGAAVAARYAMRLRRPVRVYGVLELSIAVCALGVPWGIRALNALYVGLLGGGSALAESASLPASLFQLAGAFALLLLPTAFMGATLPLLARHAVRREEEIASRVGVLYAVNTAGAIAGTLCAAFLLLPELGLRRTVWVGVAVNTAVFGLAVLLAGRAPLPPTPAGAGASARTANEPFWILPAIALSGAVSFAYEVMWTRLLGHLLGASLHAFATMLASFLLGIALGSAVAARLAASRERAALGFAWSQLGIAVTAYVAFALADGLPEFAASLGAGPDAPLASAAVAGAVLLPIALCIGATFPFAVRVLAQDPDRAAVATARVYAWNTVGALAGALGAGFVLLPGLGFEGLLTLGVVASLVLAALAALAVRPRRLGPVGAAAAAGLVLLLAPARPPWRLLTSSPGTVNETTNEIYFSAVGRTSNVMLTNLGGRYRLTTDGLPEALIDPAGLPPEPTISHWLGLLPALLRPEARDLLVVGLGGGVTLELAPRSYQWIDVIEIEPEVLAANRWIADERARDPLSDPRVRVHIGDARGALQLTAKRYDAIVSQPSHPWTAGASHLYTREFFALVRARLKSDGVFVQWIGTAYVDAALLRSLLATLLEVFPHVELFRPQVHGVLFVASGTPIDTLAGAARALQAAPADFARVGLHRLEDIASAWALDEAGVRALAAGAPPNTDDHNRLATRSGRLDKTGINAESARTLLDRHDPLLGAPGLDRSALIRRLMSRGLTERAIDLAMAGEGASEEAGLGWVELAAGRSDRASRHFERAMSLSPGNRDAMAGRIVSQKFELSHGRTVPGISDAALDPRYAALIAGWRHAVALNWKQVRDLDAELARIEPGASLFEEATRLRIAAHLAANDSEAAVEAQALAETLLSRNWNPYDALLRARAAIRADRPHAAWVSLRRVAGRASATPRGHALGEKFLEIARELPEDRFRALRDAITRRGHSVSPDSAGLREPPVPRETPR
ncbi:MAG: fused MFS/spermidine synthase [Myxococcota bacterium]